MSLLMSSTIDLDNPDTVKVQIDGQGELASLCKTICRDDFIRLLSRKDDGVVKTRIPRLPQGTVDVAWANKDNYSISIFVPAEKRPTAYMREENSHLLPYPNLLFYFEVGQGVMLTSRVFAVRDNYWAIGEDTELCYFPYGNVYSDGKICWGSNDSIANLKDGVKGLERVIGVFFNGIMNNDLYSRDKTRYQKDSLERLLSDMVLLDSFPAEMLSGTGHDYRFFGFGDE